MKLPELATVKQLAELVEMGPADVVHHIGTAGLKPAKGKKYNVLEFLQAVDSHQHAAKRTQKAEHLKQYQFKKGQSGNPAGRAKGKSVTVALRAIVEDAGLAKQLADTAVQHALAGDFRYWAGIMDRLEGKVPMVVASQTLPDLTPEEAAAMQAKLLEAASLEAIDYDADLEPAPSNGKNGQNGKNGRKNGRRMAT